MNNPTIDLHSKEIWEKAKKIYLEMLSSLAEKEQASRYFSMITEVARVDNMLVVSTSSEYIMEFFKSNYAEKLEKCLALVDEDDHLKLDFKVSKVTETVITPSPKPITKKPEAAANVSTFNSPLPLNEEYVFDEFVRGPSNSWAFAAAQGVVANPGKSSYNPLFIHGGTGLGKTHLMQAIGNELRKKNPQMAVCYLTAETFLNEYLNSLQNGQIQSFREKYRSIDVLLVDDVQFLQKKNQFQEEFFNTFNALQQAKKQIVMTSDVAPKNLPSIEERLISRFEGGMVQEIESPNYETRLAILRKKSESLDVKVPESALQFIAETIKSHVRAMEGALRKVSIFVSIDPNTLLTNEILAHLLNDFIEKEISLKNLSIEEIQTTVAKKYSVSIAQILSSERTQSIVTPRQLAMYISRKFTTKSLPEIAKNFDKTHATIIHGVRNIEKRLDVEDDLKLTLSEILESLGCSLADKLD